LEPVTVTPGATVMSDTLSLVVFAICVSTYQRGFSTSVLVVQLVEIVAFVLLVLFGVSRVAPVCSQEGGRERGCVLRSAIWGHGCNGCIGLSSSAPWHCWGLPGRTRAQRGGAEQTGGRETRILREISLYSVLLSGDRLPHRSHRFCPQSYRQSLASRVHRPGARCRALRLRLRCRTNGAE